MEPEVTQSEQQPALQKRGTLLIKDLHKDRRRVSQTKIKEEEDSEDLPDVLEMNEEGQETPGSAQKNRMTPNLFEKPNSPLDNLSISGQEEQDSLKSSHESPLDKRQKLL